MLLLGSSTTTAAVTVPRRFDKGCENLLVLPIITLLFAFNKLLFNYRVPRRFDKGCENFWFCLR
jgi:hypothetical protein